MVDHVRMLLWCLPALALVSWLWRALATLLWRPLALTRSFAKQGVRGPAYAFFSGSLREIRAMNAAASRMALDVQSHDITPRVLPHYHAWSSQYGGTFLYWFGTQPRICITDPEMAKQVLSKFSFYVKPSPRPSVLSLLGKGLTLSEGLDWVRHRRVVGPAFTMDKLKGMSKKMADCTISMLNEWQDQLVHEKGDQCKEVEMNVQFKELTANVICHTAFGSGFAEGKEVFLAQTELQWLAFATAFDVPLPGRRYIPTRTNLQKRRLDRRIREKLTGIIQRRMDSNSTSYGDDLLGLMMDACRTDSEGIGKGNLRMSMDEIIDECKTFFFAGHETTSHLLTWTTFLLSSNPQWQEKLREEVLRECGKEVPDAEMLSKLKLTTMVLLEALRLYCPVVTMLRKATQDMKLGNLAIPKGTTVTIPLTMIHRNHEFWGADANDFKPLRFENGISRAAKHPNALLSFSVGPRSCVGQNFAMLEARLVVAMILQRFSFSLSSNYRHAPTNIITLHPQFGLPVVIRPLHT